MENKITKFVALLLIIALMGCSDNPLKTNGEFEFNTIGTHQFIINANEIKANITVVSGGGGGGGGVTNTSGISSTGGGGGGGAAEVKVYSSVTLEKNTTYTVIIGDGGIGGTPSNNGIDGQPSKIMLNLADLFTSVVGSGGKSNPANTTTGGLGGAGFPAGSNGGNGTIADASGNAAAGTGGTRGINSSSYGFGGNGGAGTRLINHIASPPSTGSKGTKGYVKIQWVGVED